jgi:hypothetical protein
MVLFKGTVIFRQYIPKKYKEFGVKIYKLCYSKGYTYNMITYLGKDRKHVTSTGTITQAIETELTARIENVWHELIMDSFFLFPEVCNDLLTKIIKCCCTVRR